MKYTVVERQLKEVGKRISRYKDELAIADEQLHHLQNEAEDARMKSLVSETAISDHERRDSARQAENMGNYCLKIKNEINRLENLQDKMLDKLTMEKNDGSSKSSYS